MKDLNGHRLRRNFVDEYVQAHLNTRCSLECRYDLLCLEGLAQSLRIFIGLDPIPVYAVANISKESMLKLHVKPEVRLSKCKSVLKVVLIVSFHIISALLLLCL